MSTISEIVPFSETISQTAQEGSGVGGQVTAKSEIPEIEHSAQTSQPGQEGLRVRQHVRTSTMPEVGPLVSESKSKMKSIISSDAASDGDRTYFRGECSYTVPQNRNGLDGIVTERKKLKSALGENSVEIELFQASKDSKWFDAIEKKNCKLLLKLFRSDRSLWVQTGLNGRSVLHVAVMQGCSELVGELHNYEGDLVPCGKNWQTPFEFLWENAKDGRLKDASAQDVWFVMEGPSLNTRHRESSQSELLADRSRDDYIQSYVKGTMCVDDEMLSLREAISSIAIKQNFVMDENDVDFNFENVERKELYVHMACSRLRNVRNKEDCKRCCDQIVGFIHAVLTDLLGKNLLPKLFDQKDAQGRTILQVFALCILWRHEGKCRGVLTSAFKTMLDILPKGCVNTRDKAGRTVLHWAVAHDTTWAVEKLLESGKAGLDVTFQTAYIDNIAAFHLILLYDHNLPYFYHRYLQDELKRHFCYSQFANADYFLFDVPLEWIAKVPLVWAIEMGRNKFVKQVMETEEYKELYPPKKNEFLSHAAYTGNVEILQLFLQKGDVDELNDDVGVGAPPLHLAIKAQAFWRGKPDSRTFDDWLHCNDFISIELLEKKLQAKDLEEDNAIANIDKTKYGVPNINQYSAKQACANLLLQAGADILATNEHGKMADPGSRAPNEARIWWYELVAKETLNMKSNLHAAGTKTAVVATLVATASFVGPLTPPLNYVAMLSGTATIDVGVRVTELLIRVFLMSNELSFYLAITSIMLAIMPSLPIPKEGLVSGPCDDLKRSRRTISIAIGMLLASIISVLISFAASSLVVIPLQHRGLMAYSMTTIGGLICCIGIFFFFLRFLRLIYPRNTFIKKLYQRIGKL